MEDKPVPDSKSKKWVKITLIVGIICTIFGLFNMIPLLTFGAPRIMGPMLIGIIILIVGIICLIFSFYFWMRLKAKSELPKEQTAPKEIKKDISSLRNNYELDIKSLMNDLKSEYLTTVQKNVCPNCSTDLNLADELRLIKYVNCPTCDISIPLKVLIDGKCPKCLNNLTDAEINKLKLILCPKCKKTVKG